MKPSGIGGQAVIEGVMMKNQDIYATAVRKPDHEIVIEKSTYVSKAKKYKLFKLPVFRGMLAFAESMVIGTKTLTFSSGFYEEAETKPTKVESAFSKVFKDKTESIIMGITFLISILLAVGIFIILPGFIAELLEKLIKSDVILAITEGCIRILIFIAYIVAISQLKDIKRLFMYHGAEHKTINCIEHGLELTVENVKRQSKHHKRCGTSFIFIVLLVSIIFFLFIPTDLQWLRYLIRILLIPAIAGVSYEFIRYAGRSSSFAATILSLPGLWMQRLTTKEPDDDMIEVAIKAVEAVFDWKDFINNGRSFKNRNRKNKSNKNNHRRDYNVDYNSEIDNILDKSDTMDKIIANRNEDKQSKKHPDRYEKQMVGPTDRSDNDVFEEMDQNLDKTDKKQRNSREKAKYVRDVRKESDEIAATSENIEFVKPKTIFDEEEDDEILRALDRYLTYNEDSNNVDSGKE
jgi:uncharacterized protein YqhQ